MLLVHKYKPPRLVGAEHLFAKHDFFRSWSSILCRGSTDAFRVGPFYVRCGVVTCQTPPCRRSEDSHLRKWSCVHTRYEVPQ